MLKEYRTTLEKGTRTVEEFHKRLAQQGLLVEQKGKFVPTGFGTLLFGNEPRILLPQAGLLSTIHYDDGREEPRDFDGPAVEAADQAIAWLKDKLPNPITRTSAKRKEVRETFYELLREGIVNALVHRDYAIKGAKCQLIASPHKVVVMSPGAPVEPVTTAEYQEAMGVPNRTAKFHMKRMADLGLLRVVGAGRATRYEVRR